MYDLRRQLETTKAGEGETRALEDKLDTYKKVAFANLQKVMKDNEERVSELRKENNKNLEKITEMRQELETCKAENEFSQSSIKIENDLTFDQLNEEM